MFFYTCAYNLALIYSRVHHYFSHYNPFYKLKKRVVDDNAIRKAKLININSVINSEETIYEYDWLCFLFDLYLMWFAYGTDDWVNVHRKYHTRYNIDDSRLENSGMFLHVLLENGKEYVTRCGFDSRCLHEFTYPSKKYLCVTVAGLDITSTYKRFITSWNALDISHDEFIHLITHLDQHILAHVMKNTTFYVHNVPLVLVDDDTVEEKECMADEVLVF